MSFKKVHNLHARQGVSQRVGVHNRALIRASEDNLKRLGSLRFYCNHCARWLPALTFYAKVTHSKSDVQQENGIPYDALYLARYEVNAEGSKGNDIVVVCEDCAERAGQDPSRA